MTINEFAKKRKYLFWFTRNFEHLSKEAIVEGVLNYGDFNDVKEIISILGMQEIARIFRKQTKPTRRINYDHKIVNYFTLFFQKYA